MVIHKEGMPVNSTDANHCQSYQKELERLNLELALEFEMSWASERMEICELFEKAEQEGDDYGNGYADGFWAGRELQLKYMLSNTEVNEDKHNELLIRWGILSEQGTN